LSSLVLYVNYTSLPVCGIVPALHVLVQTAEHHLIKISLNNTVHTF